MSETQKHWYAVYTRPRWEKKLASILQEKGVECYCPLNKVTRQWSDRRKIVLEPLFKGYLFVRVSPADLWSVKNFDGILNYVFWEGKPAVIRDQEIENVRRFLLEFEEVEVHDIKQAGRVKVKQGVMMNFEGIVLEIRGKQAFVRIDYMGLELSAVFERKNLLPI
ncbi:MAG TPA: UpxY family transcription antiterminator [Ferruginibacter sp.]|nr:UpxY family transcription antiterminator [Ferruginibacter sp.]